MRKMKCKNIVLVKIQKLDITKNITKIKIMIKINYNYKYISNLLNLIIVLLNVKKDPVNIEEDNN